MAGEMERRLCSKNLVHAVFVEGCEVNSSTRRSIMLSGNYHAVAPCHRLAVWDPLNDTKCFILPEILVHLSVPVDGYIGRCVTSLRSRARVYMYFNRRCFHAWQWSMGTGIKCGTCVSFKQPVFHDSIVCRGALEREYWRARWCYAALRARARIVFIFGCVVQPSLTSRTTVIWVVSSGNLFDLPTSIKARFRMPRFSIESYERYIVHTAKLTYIPWNDTSSAYQMQAEFWSSRRRLLQ